MNPDSTPLRSDDACESTPLCGDVSAGAASPYSDASAEAPPPEASPAPDPDDDISRELAAMRSYNISHYSNTFGYLLLFGGTAMCAVNEAVDSAGVALFAVTALLIGSFLRFL